MSAPTTDRFMTRRQAIYHARWSARWARRKSIENGTAGKYAGGWSMVSECNGRYMAVVVARPGGVGLHTIVEDHDPIEGHERAGQKDRRARALYWLCQSHELRNQRIARRQTVDELRALRVHDLAPRVVTMDPHELAASVAAWVVTS